MNIIQVYKQFPTDNDCIAHLESVRWPGGAECPYCKSKNATRMPNENRYHCNSCNTSYSVTVGTIFHDTKLDLQKWFLAISLILNAKKGISSRQLARDLEVNKNTSWYMAMRIRKAMMEQRELLTGVVEMDETYIGGKPRKENDRSGGGSGGVEVGADMNPEIKEEKRNTKADKIAVIGVVERGGKVRAKIAKDLTAKTLGGFVREKVKIKNATVMTDEYSGYCSLKYFVKHRTINHSQQYVCGYIHTNTIESFWAILKRGIVGQFHKVSVTYLPKYIDEFCYRYNNRKNDGVFDLTIARALGVR